MNRVMKRVGWVAALVPLAFASGCNNSTEIPLANVPPVTVVPAKKAKPSPYARITSPPVLPGQTN